MATTANPLLWMVVVRGEEHHHTPCREGTADVCPNLTAPVPRLSLCSLREISEAEALLHIQSEQSVRIDMVVDQAPANLSAIK
jgi:hypothetical protein